MCTFWIVYFFINGLFDHPSFLFLLKIIQFSPIPNMFWLNVYKLLKTPPKYFVIGLNISLVHLIQLQTRFGKADRMCDTRRRIR